MTQNQAKIVYKNLQHIFELERRRESIAMELFCHPDATANQVMELQGKLGKARADYMTMLSSIAPKLAPALPHRYDLGELKL